MRVKVKIPKGDIRSAREGLGETQASMAERMGVSLGGWQQWEYGTRPLKGPALKLFQLICEKEGISINLPIDITEISSKMLSTSRSEVLIEEANPPQLDGRHVPLAKIRPMRGKR